MGQVLHGSAKTTHAIRAAIQRSQASIKELSERGGAVVGLEGVEPRGPEQVAHELHVQRVIFDDEDGFRHGRYAFGSFAEAGSGAFPQDYYIGWTDDHKHRVRADRVVQR